MEGLTEEQINALKFALADLEGSLDCMEEPDNHDWEAHQYTIVALKRAFPFLVTAETLWYNIY